MNTSPERLPKRLPNLTRVLTMHPLKIEGVFSLLVVVLLFDHSVGCLLTACCPICAAMRRK